MYRPIVLLFLLLPALAPAQVFQKVIFHHNKKQLTDVLEAGQRIKIFAPDEKGNVRSFKGRLRDVRHDSLFLWARHETRGFALAQVEEIQYRTPPARRMIWGLLIAGFLFVAAVSFLWLPSFATGNPSPATLGALAGVGAGLLLLAPVVGIFSKRWISHPAVERTIEVMDMPPQNQP